MNKIEDYTPYGEEWEKFIMRLPKKKLVELLRHAKTGTVDVSCCSLTTVGESQNFVEGVRNDYRDGVIDDSEFMTHMGNFVGRLQHFFINRAIELVKKNPEMLNQEITEVSFHREMDKS